MTNDQLIITKASFFKVKTEILLFFNILVIQYKFILIVLIFSNNILTYNCTRND